MSIPFEELLDFDVATLADKLHARDISPVELTEAYLGRIERTDASIRAYITVTDTLARKTAKKAEAEIAAGKWRGPFHGVPIALKDLVYTKNIRTTGGSKILADFKPDHDATVWKRLAARGQPCCSENSTCTNSRTGSRRRIRTGAIVRNPYALDRIPGGSSGGSAAAIVARSAPPRSAPTPAVRSGFQPRSADASGSSPPGAASAATEYCHSPTRSTTSARSRARCATPR